jgi:hypothetical protein
VFELWLNKVANVSFSFLVVVLKETSNSWYRYKFECAKEANLQSGLDHLPAPWALLLSLTKQSAL